MSIEVSLNIYDLSMGMAKHLSQQFVGKQFDHVYHTGIVVFGMEYFYGGGIMKMPPSQTPYGTPISTILLGTTSKTQKEFENWISLLQNSKYHFSKYDLFENNCNNFTQDACQFLCGTDFNIPSEIRNQPSEFKTTEMGRLVANMMNGMRTSMFGENGQNFEYSQVHGSSTTNNLNSTNSSNSSNHTQNTNRLSNNDSSYSNNNFQNNTNSFSNPIMNQALQDPQLLSEMMRSPITEQILNQQGMGDIYNNPMFQQVLNNPQMLQGMLQNPMAQSMLQNQQYGQYNGSTNYNPYANNSQSSNLQSIVKTKNQQTFDENEIYRFKTANIPAVVNKLRSLAKEKEISISNEESVILDKIERYLKGENNLTLINEKTLTFLERMMQSLQGQEFPVLDILRLLLLTAEITKLSIEIQFGPFKFLLEKLLPKWKTLPMPTQLMSLRILCNIFSESQSEEQERGYGRKFIVQNEDRFHQTVEILTHSLTSTLEGIRFTATSLACNLSLFAKYDGSDEETQLLCSMIEFIGNETNEDVAQRMILCILRLIKGSEEYRSLTKELNPDFSKWKNNDKTKLLASRVMSMIA